MTPVEQIKSRLSITDVVSWYVKLVRAGSNFKAPCPFHTERTPSFFVSPPRDRWHCFGCGIGGDQFQFIMQIEGMDFREALQFLADRAGVVIKPENPQERDERARLFSLLEEAVQFYETHLSRASAVQEYLKGRGVLDGTITAFRIGYAPPEISGWRVFTEHALKKGFTLAELEKTGLAIRKQTTSNVVPATGYKLQATSFYDRFRNRIMFPITDANGRVIGFGGRIFQDTKYEIRNTDKGDQTTIAKYINTPQTSLYDKSKVLYAFDKAKTAIRKENTCIVVEGYMDAIMAHQAGTGHAVAVSGTALTRDQLTMIQRLCNTLILSFDMDDAGESATRRGIDLALQMSFDVKAIAIPSGKDPADLVQSDVASWRQVALQATDIVSYFLDKALARNNAHALEGKRNITKSVLPLVARITREVEKAHWVSVIASRLQVRDESVWQDMKNYRFSASQNPVSTSAVHGPVPGTLGKEEHNRMRVLEDRILGILYAHSIPIPASLTEQMFSSETARALFKIFSLQQSTSQALAVIGDEGLRSFVNRLTFEAEMLVSSETATAECEVCIAELERERVKEKLAKLTHDIRKAEEAGNSQQLPQLIEEFQMISKQLV